MKNLLLPALAFLICFSSCKEPSKKEETREDIAIRIGTDYLKGTLKDPESLKIYKAFTKSSRRNMLESIFIDYGAKNGFGGMVRNFVVLDIYGNEVTRTRTLQEYTDEEKEWEEKETKYEDSIKWSKHKNFVTIPPQD